MKTKKALGGLFGLLGSLAAFFDCFLPAPAPLRFNLNDTSQKKKKNVKRQPKNKNAEHKTTNDRSEKPDLKNIY